MTNRLSIKLSKNAVGDYDMVLEDGKFEWSRDGTAVAQHGMERLLIFRGEQSLGGILTGKDDLGTWWYEIIFDASKSRAEKELEIKSRILGTPGVLRILQFNWEQTGGAVSLTGRVLTEYGEIDIAEEITVL
jgi:hypothetical protein